VDTNSRTESKAARLRELLTGPRVARFAGARDALTARLVEKAGFDGVWASSFELSATQALPDISLLSMSDLLGASVSIDAATELPMLADCDTGFGGRANIAHMVQRYEASGIAGVCIEDKVFPKKNSFVNEGQILEEVGEFAARVELAKKSQQRSDFVVVARVEAFVAGMDVDEVLRRANAYADAGADAVLIHSKRSGPEEIRSFLAGWQSRRPVVVVPTTYPQWTAAQAATEGVAMVIYANQTLRASIRATQDVLAAISEADGSATVEAAITPVKEVFELVGMNSWTAMERQPARSIDVKQPVVS
jgi:phosphoenolpyruvate phosphomutase